MYFDTETLRLKYLMVDGQDLVFASKWGFQERGFDHEFDSFRECPETATKVLESGQEKLKKQFNGGLFAGI